MVDTKRYTPFIIGHRGAAAYAPENTMASIELAYQLGVRCIEVDVMLTADQHAVIFHDNTLNRCTTAQGAVSDKQWHTIKQLDAGSWFHPDFTGQGIPHLNDLVKFANKHPDLTLNIEIKPRFKNSISTTRIVINYLKQHLIKPERLIISSFDVVALKMAQFMWPSCYRALNIEKRFYGWSVFAKSLGCSAVHIDHQQITSAFIHTAHRLHLDVRAFTVNDPFRARQLKAMQIDGIFSDCPADLFQHIH
ncbi:glycerophosphodiester phosphodiesterase family protein [Litoribacillus peritrichatus]|uniref:Glycerophosphodiester phosphodiesterase n=1 Tax=Litoribacillus peritrichatus TaxID=718191 RepID=A0ABP7LZR6_9GAMM